MSKNVRRSAVMRLTHASRIAIRPIGICGCVDLRDVPSARAANNLLAIPLFPLAVERCALTCVTSTICVSVARAGPASSRNRFSQIPRQPAHNAIVDSSRRTIFGRAIAPAAATSQKMNDATDDAEIICRVDPRDIRRKMRDVPFPLRLFVTHARSQAASTRVNILLSAQRKEV